MNLIVVGLLSWEQFPVRLRATSCQLVAPSTSESKIPSIPHRDFGSREQSPLSFTSMRLIANLSIARMKVINSGIIPQKCWKKKIAKLFDSYSLCFMNECEIKMFSSKNRKRKKRENFPPATETINLKNVFLAKGKWPEMNAKRNEEERIWLICG